MNVLTYEQLKQQLEAMTLKNENHRQTLAGIRSMDPATEGERMQQWASDALSGYTESTEATVKSLTNEKLALVAENALLLPKAASELSNAWVLNKYWVGINAALMHLEMGRVDMAQEWLLGTIAGPGLERPELEEVDDIDAWAEHQNRGSISHAKALEILKAEAPTTAAAMAEIKAQGVEEFIVWATAPSGFDTDLTTDDAQEFADELREGRV